MPVLKSFAALKTVIPIARVITALFETFDKAFCLSLWRFYG
jgi:hypothetical protein